MASPVDTSVKFHLSTFSGAPVLSGTTGAMIGLLDAFLVDGYDTKSVSTLVVADGVATATFSAGHSSVVDTVVRIAGCTGSWTDLNGDQKVISRPGSTSLQFATELSNGTATGTITLKMAPAGWTKVFTGTNKAVYQSADPESTGMYLRVDDNAALSARVVGYEVMTDVDTGTAPFPTDAQASGGGHWYKSAVANATARPYQFVCDARFFAFSMPVFISLADTWTGAHPVRGFGDCIPISPAGDAYACAISCGRAAISSAEQIMRGDFSQCDTATSDSGTIGSTFVPRSHLNTGASTRVSTSCDNIGATSSVLYSSASGFHGAFPSPVNGRLLMSRQRIHTAYNSSIARAYLPGLFFLPQSGVAAYFDIGSVTPAGGGLSGRKVMMIGASTSGASQSAPNLIAVDITGPWR